METSNYQVIQSNDLAPYRSELPSRVSDDFEPIRAFEQGLRQYLRVVLKYRQLIISVFSSLILISLLWAFTVTPQYTARAVIRIDSFEPLLGTGKVEDALIQKSSRQDYLETQIQQMTSLSLADAVLADESFRAALVPAPTFWSSILGGEVPSEPGDDGEISGYRTPQSLLKSYLQLVKVTPVKRTMLVNIDITHRDKAWAARLANRHAEEYISWVRVKRIEQQSSGVEFLANQATEIREKVESLEREIAEYAEINSIVALNKDENVVVQKMSRLNQLIADATAKSIEANHKWEQAKSSATLDSAGYDDDSVRRARGDLMQLESQLSELSQKFNESYPKVRQLKAQVAGIRASIGRQRDSIVRGYQANAQASRDELKALKAELDSQKGLAFDLAKRQVRYNALNAELESSRELLQTVSRQTKELGLALESNGSNIALVDRALVPRIASYPNKTFMVLTGGAIGLILGLILAFALHHLDNTIRTAEDVANVLNLSSLGYIPRFDQVSLLGRKSASEELGQPDQIDQAQKSVPLKVASVQTRKPVVTLNTRSPVAEAYRSIRTNLFLSRAGKLPRLLLVTSAIPGEGKTTVASNLTATLASTGASVIIVDADLRKPTVHKHFPIPPNSPGVSDVLTQQVALEVAIVKTPLENVSVLPCGTLPPNPSELVGSEEMKELLETLRGMYDFVVVDSAPIVPVSDTVLLSAQVDGVVFVIGSGSTPARAAHEAKCRLEKAGAKILGVLLNRADVQGKDYYYYRYHSDSVYGEKSSEVGERAA